MMIGRFRCLHAFLIVFSVYLVVCLQEILDRPRIYVKNGNIIFQTKNQVNFTSKSVNINGKDISSIKPGTSAPVQSQPDLTDIRSRLDDIERRLQEGPPGLRPLQDIINQIIGTGRPSENIQPEQIHRVVRDFQDLQSNVDRLTRLVNQLISQPTHTNPNSPSTPLPPPASSPTCPTLPNIPPQPGVNPSNESAILSCGGTLYGTGNIRSPSFPGLYPTNKDCVWIVSTADNHQLHVTFTQFDLENHTNCDYDYLEIRNGGDETSPLLGKFCGNRIPSSFMSYTNRLLIHFKSDESQTGTGFEMIFDGGSSGCGGKLNAPTGVVESPNYPQPYGHEAECLWTIQVSRGSTISIFLVDVDIEVHQSCGYDYVEVFDGDSDMTTSLGKFCNPSSVHKILHSSSNVMAIKFKTDATKSSRGFRLSYTTNCTVTIAGYRGVIESPNFPYSYPHDLKCSWEIVAPAGNNVTFAFTHLDLEEGERFDGENRNSCRSDVVEFLERDMFTFDYKHLKTFCGQSAFPRLPEPFKSSSPMVKVNFTTDLYSRGTGFRLEWISVGCGGDFVGKTKGTIRSPNFPNGYPRNTECIWHITADPGKVIELRISTFDLEAANECTFDYLKVINGPDVRRSPVMMTMCHKIPSDVPLILTSTSNQLTLAFKSDESITGKGFELTYRAKRGGCSVQFVRVEKATITSPNYPNNFNPPIDCNYYINGGPLNTIKVTFDDLSMPSSENCSKGSVSVYEGFARGDNSVLGQYCGNGKPIQPIRTETSNALIAMTSEVSAKGFSASFEIVCGGRKEVSPGQIGTLTTPNYPHGSVNLYGCNWTFIAKDPSEKIALTFNRIFSVQSPNPDDESCATDFGIYVKDGDDANAPILKHICKSESPKPIVSTGSALRVELVKGMVFRANFASSSATCASPGVILASDQGEFMSPGYPLSYPINATCWWVIRAPRGNRIRLSFVSIDIEESEFCNNDYVEVREGSKSGKILGRYCGKQIPIISDNVTDASILYIKFKSDGSGSAAGFEAKYNLVHGVTLTGSSGVIDSPGYPWGLFTPSSTKFKWTILTPPGTFVLVTFSQMELATLTYPVLDEDGRPTNEIRSECNQYVKLLDGIDEESRELGTFCGLTLPPTVVSSSNVMTVIFYPYTSFTGKWSLNYEAVNVPGPTIIRTDPVIETSCLFKMRLKDNEPYMFDSPGYPTGYENNFNCSWIFQSRTGTHISFKIVDFDTEGTNPCYYDVVKVFEETPNDDAIIGTTWKLNKTLCGRIPANTTFEIMSTRAKLDFITDNFYNYSGFRMMLTPKCGGTLLDPRGVISSRLIQSTSSVSCQWIIHVTEGRTIRFTFDDFNIPSQRGNCEDASLTIRNGQSKTSPVMLGGKVCGIRRPVLTTETTSNHAVIQFVFNEGSVMPTFKILYEEVSLQCGGFFTLTDDNPLIAISSPSDLRPNLVCDFVISAPAMRNLRVDFDAVRSMDQSWDPSRRVGPKQFDTETCDTDGKTFLAVHDGGTIASPLLRTLCPPLPSLNSIKSSGQMILIRYVTTTASSIPFSGKVSINDCGGTFLVDFHEKIIGPFNGRNYTNDMDCRYIITTLPHYSLSVTAFKLDFGQVATDYDCSTGDYIEVRDGGEDGESLGKLCKESDRNALLSSSNVLFIRFKSDSDNISGKGFELVITVNFRPCGRLLESNTGTIESPNFPNPFPNVRKCIWSFRFSPGKKIRLNFVSFNLKSDVRDSSRCLDKLFLRRTIPQFLPVHVTPINCGNELPKAISFAGNTDLVFETKGLEINEGFSLNYEEVDVDSLDYPDNCGGTVDRLNQIIASPGLDPKDTSVSLPIGKTVNCIWNFDMDAILQQVTPNPNSDVDDPVAKTFSLRFDVFEVGSDLVIGVNGRCQEGIFIAPNGLSTINGYCGNKTGDGNFFFALNPPFNNIHFDLLTNVTSNRRGLRGTFGIQNCGGIYNHPQNVNITSPGYPRGYPANTLCQWIFRLSSSDQHLVLNFRSFNLENDCTKDFLEIKFGIWDLAPRLPKACGQNNPGVIKTQEALVVTFKTDSQGSAPGFKFSASTQSDVCGGHFKDPMVNIQTPDFPNRDYSNNMECIWIIEEEESYRILFTFEDHFDLEMDRNCSKDYLLIEEWFDKSWVPLAKLCGHDLPTPIETRTHKARLTFRTNEAVTASGFRLTYNILCGGILTEDDGIITSPNYPKPYPPGLSCGWSITRPGSAILLTIEDLSIENDATGRCSFDSLTLFYGNNSATSNPKVGPICGNDLDASLDRYSSFINGRSFVTYNRTYISFVSDASVNLRGFKMRFKILDCGGNITSSVGVIKRPDFPSSVGRFNCVWRIRAPADRSIQLKFRRYTLPNCGWSMERVDIFDGGNSSTPLLHFLCGKSQDSDKTLPPIILSSGNELMIDYTNYPMTMTEDKNFEIYYRFVLGERQGCGGVIMMNQSFTSGYITSPDADNDGKYEDGLDCQWILVSGFPDYNIQLSFDYFALEEESNSSKPCIYDYLEVRDGPSVDSPLISKLCGSTIPSSISSSSDKVYVHFHTDSGINMKGFKVNYSAKKLTCGGQVSATNRTQVVNSPNFPSPYDPGQRCRWHFLLQGSRYGFAKISLNFTAFDVSCDNGDMVEFSFSRGTYSPYRMCGDKKDPPRLIGPNDLWMTFQSGPRRMDNYKGFSVEYKIADCNQTYTKDHGLILSPNYADTFSDEDYCLMRINVPPSHSISLYFFRFAIRSLRQRTLPTEPSSSSSCSEARMEVREGNDMDSPLLATLCGKGPPDPIFSMSNQLLIYVKAPVSEHMYNIIYSSTDKDPGCGGNITTFNGTFTSPLYPNAYTGGTTPCVWHIQSLGHHKITISFPSLSLTQTRRCRDNRLEVFDGPDDGDEKTKVASFCGQEPPEPITSSGSDLTVRLTVSESNQGFGFKANIKMEEADIDPGQKVVSTALKEVWTSGRNIFADNIVIPTRDAKFRSSFVPRTG